MKSKLLVQCLSLLTYPVIGRFLIQNVEGQKTASLNGRWQSIVCPYENGLYNYRYEPRSDGYLRNQKPATKSDLIEYNFDTSDPLNVPGD